MANDSIIQLPSTLAGDLHSCNLYFDALILYILIYKFAH